jgi:hypothetical protein
VLITCWDLAWKLLSSGILLLHTSRRHVPLDSNVLSVLIVGRRLIPSYSNTEIARK